MYHEAHQMLRTLAVFFFTSQDRGNCYGFSGKKYFLHWHRNYLVMATVDERGRYVVYFILKHVLEVIEIKLFVCLENP